MLRLLDDSEHVTFTHRSETHMHANPENGVVFEVKGIPVVSYIAYENHAFRTGDAKAIYDMESKDLHEAASIIWSVNSKEDEAEGQCLTYSLSTSEQGEVSLVVSERKYNANWSGPVAYYKIADSAYKSAYAASVLGELAGVAESKGYGRFYCIDKDTIMIAEAVDLNESKKDEHGIPEVVRKDSDVRLFFFFASASEPDESE